MFGGGSALTPALAYAAANGGGAVAVSSQSAAASAVLDSGADVAGLGGFSGRESEISVDWLAQRVADGSIRWVDVSGGSPGMPNDGRAGSTAAMDAVTQSCTAVASVDGLYDCAGAASALARAG